MSLLKNKQINGEEIGECSSGIYKILCNGTTNGAICLSDFWISLPKFKPSCNWVWHLQDKAQLHVLLAVLKSNDISGPWASSWRLGQSFPQSSQWWGDVRKEVGEPRTSMVALRLVPPPEFWGLWSWKSLWDKLGPGGHHDSVSCWPFCTTVFALDRSFSNSIDCWV